MDDDIIGEHSPEETAPMEKEVQTFEHTPWQEGERQEEVSLHENATFDALDFKKFTVSVGQPEKHGEGIKDAYISYSISCTTRDGSACRVRRRYQDFVWLLDHLSPESTAIPACVIKPPLPERNRLEYLDRFAPEFIQRRQWALHRFIQRLLSHPLLGGLGVTEHFLKADLLLESMGVGAQGEENGGGGPSSPLLSSVVGHVSDVVLNAFGKTRAIEGRFLQMRTIVGMLEGHFSKLERLFIKMLRTFQGLCKAVKAGSVALEQAVNASILLPREYTLGSPTGSVISVSLRSPEHKHCPVGGNLPSLLTRIALLGEEDAELLKSLCEGLEDHMIGSLQEYVNYCGNAKIQLKLRDTKQFEYEDLQDYLSRARQEREALKGPPAATSTPPNNTETTRIESLGTFIAQRVDRFRGIDPITSQQQRLQRLDKRIGDLVGGSHRAKQAAAEIDEIIEREFDSFQRLLLYEMTQHILPMNAKLFREYHEAALRIWTDFSERILILK